MVVVVERSGDTLTALTGGRVLSGGMMGIDGGLLLW